MLIDTDLADMHLITRGDDGTITKRPAHLAVMAASSKMIKAAVTFARSSGAALPTSFDLSDYSAAAVNRVMDVVYCCATVLPEFEEWIDAIKLAHYLDIVWIGEIISTRPSTINLVRLIDTALQLRIGDMIFEIHSCEITKNEMCEALVEKSNSDIIWMLMSADKKLSKLRRHILLYGILTRKTAAEVDELLMYLLKFDCASECREILSAESVPLTPISRRFLEYIISTTSRDD